MHSEASFLTRYFGFTAANDQLRVLFATDHNSIEPVLLNHNRNVRCVYLEAAEDCSEALDANDGGAFGDFELRLRV
jgi:hypothetical protein